MEHLHTLFVDGGSKKGSRKLVSSEGYAFVLKRTLVSGVPVPPKGVCARLGTATGKKRLVQVSF
ncbi:hypothetical protein DPMN_079680 [Dreissena polymorpha]|uniref:Uncharacterized protein n=1 Tax=Dreissena polymorpha TaxID=45954 RepID=A0A9D3YU73_DREPO|nr:hypothetical protein DPMN_079644 [Dreissena polymorpha]KAH3704621.1 hypothetical protein DPMN_079680 [Dreissena polymorpha]